MKKYLTSKNAIIVGLIALTLIIAYIVYRMYFEFKGSDVKGYIKDEANKCIGNEDSAYSIIQDGVKHILSSSSLTDQVIKTAKLNGTSKEQELVHAAVMQCISLGYIGDQSDNN